MRYAFAYRRLGDWRVNLVLAAFGWALYLNAIMKLSRRSVSDYLGWMPWESLLLSLCGLLLLAFGCRLILLGATAVVAWFHLRASWKGAHPTLEFIGEEYLLYFALPAATLVTIVLTLPCYGRGKNAPAAVDEGKLLGDRLGAVCRILVISTLGFATLAKLNHDFFDPVTSCMMLIRDIEEWWVLPERLLAGINGITPGTFIFMEGLAALFLFVWAPLGIFYTVLFTQGLANIGPTAFNFAIIALTLGFLRYDDKDAIWQGFKKTWKAGLVLILVLLPVSFSIYQGPRPWYQFALYQASSVLVLQMALLVMAGRIRQWRTGPAISLVLADRWKVIRRRFSRLGRGMRFSFPSPYRVFVITLIGLVLLNGLSPYMGIKYRVSFAMLSNLRVDRDRWNHFFMPEWLYLFEHDRYVRIVRIESDHRLHRRDDRTNRIYQVMYSQPEFKKRAEYYADNGIDFSLEIIYRGRTYSHPEALEDREFWEFVNGLSDSRRFQEWLFYGRPQHCIH